MSNKQWLYRTISDTFNTLVAQPNNLLVQYDNAPFKKPANTASWLRVTIEGGATSVEEFGGASPASLTRRTSGTMHVGIFVPTEQGDSEALRIRDLVEEAFCSKSLSEVIYDEAVTGASRPDDGWYMMTFHIPFEWDRMG